MRISDWSSDVCSSDLDRYYRVLTWLTVPVHYASLIGCAWWITTQPIAWWEVVALAFSLGIVNGLALNTGHELGHKKEPFDRRSEEHTSELQSLMRLSYAVFCLKNKKLESLRIV